MNGALVFEGIRIRKNIICSKLIAYVLRSKIVTILDFSLSIVLSMQSTGDIHRYFAFRGVGEARSLIRSDVAPKLHFLCSSFREITFAGFKIRHICTFKGNFIQRPPKMNSKSPSPPSKRHTCTKISRLFRFDAIIQIRSPSNVRHSDV